MPDIKRNVKIVTEQHVIDKPSVMEGFPMRKWTIKIYVLDEHGDEAPANIFAHAEYLLHESFGDRARQVMTTAPFKISEEGWGEFEMRINLQPIDGGKEHSFMHDLNFAQLRYETKHSVAFKKPTPAQIAILRNSGPIPGEDVPKKRAVGDETPNAGVQRKKKLGGKDRMETLEKLADDIRNVKDKDMYELIELINDNRSEDSMVQNDVDQGEFTVDLCTLPDKAITLLQAFVDDILSR